MKKYIITIEIELTQEHINLLKRCYKQKYLEYRDSEFGNIEEFLQSDLSKIKTLDFFKKRNEDGTFHLIYDLVKYDLIDESPDSWHLTYNITDLGILLLKQYKLIDLGKEL